MMGGRELFLASLEREDNEDLLELLEKHRNKNDTFDLGEVLSELSRSQLDHVWNCLQTKTTFALLKIAEDSEDANDEREEEITEMSKVLSVVSFVASLCLPSSEDNFYIPQTMIDTVVILNGILSSLPSTCERLATAIGKLSETWYLKKLPNSEALGIELLQHVLMIAVNMEKNSNASVKRVWKIHKIIEEQLNFDNNENTDLKQLILQAFICNQFLKVDEGRRFLAYAMTMNKKFIEEIHKTVKNQLPYSNMTVISWYGEIYHRAWVLCGNNEAILEHLEEYCIQDIMFHAVHTQRGSNTSMAAKLLTFLSYFHRQRQKPTKHMLSRLYGPLLWRSLKVANGDVRANAAGLFFGAFPLVCLDEGLEEADAFTQKQFDQIESLLTDNYHVIRVIAILGLRSVCTEFWELIPWPVIQGFMKTLVEQLAWDTASALVRVAVVKAFSGMLENHLCIPLLKTVLPQLCNLIHDKSEIVRIAVVDLLIKVKSLRAIKFWSIVPLDHLLYRLANDHDTVARRMTTLLIDSYLPLDRAADVRLSRCVSLLRSNPAAARKFYAHCTQRLAVNEVVDFMILIGRCVRQCVRVSRDRSEGSGIDSDSSKENISTPSHTDQDSSASNVSQNELTVDDTDTMALLLETVVVLWEGIKADLKKAVHANDKDRLRRAYRHLLRELFHGFTDSRVLSCLVLLAGFLPPDAIPTYSIGIISKLKALPLDCVEQDFATMVQSMCRWCKGRDLIELLCDWISEAYAPPPEKPSAAEKVSRKRGVRFATETPSADRSALALRILNYLMAENECQELLLHTAWEQLEALSAQLHKVMGHIENRLSGASPPAEVTEELLCGTLDIYCKLKILMHKKKVTADVDCIASVLALIEWSEKYLVVRLRRNQTHTSHARRKLLSHANMTMDKSMMPPDEATLSGTMNATMLSSTLNATSLADVSSEGGREFALRLLRLVLSVSRNMLAIGLHDCQLLSSLHDFCTLLLNSGDAALLLEDVSQLVYQVTLVKQSSQVEALLRDRGEDGSDGRLSSLEEEISSGHQQVATILNKILQCLQSHVRKSHQTAEQLLERVRPSFEQSLLAVFKHQELLLNANYDVTPSDGCDIMSYVINAILKEMTSAIKKDCHYERCEGLNQLPPICSLLMRTLKKGTYATNGFVSDLYTNLQSEEIQTDLCHISAALNLLYTMIKAHFKKDQVKDCLLQIQMLVESYHIVDVTITEDSPIRILLDNSKTLLYDSMTAIGLVA